MQDTGQSSMNQKIEKKGVDKGVDGWITIRESANINLQKIVVQVKTGTHIGANDAGDNTNERDCEESRIL